MDDRGEPGKSPEVQCAGGGYRPGSAGQRFGLHPPLVARAGHDIRRMVDPAAEGANQVAVPLAVGVCDPFVGRYGADLAEARRGAGGPRGDWLRAELQASYTPEIHLLTTLVDPDPLTLGRTEQAWIAGPLQLGAFFSLFGRQKSD